jgi:hypothetical protein
VGWGYPLGAAVVTSPRLALERLQCNNSATLFAQRARGKSGRLEVWRAPGEKGAPSRRSRWRGGVLAYYMIRNSDRGQIKLTGRELEFDFLIGPRSYHPYPGHVVVEVGLETLM